MTQFLCLDVLSAANSYIRHNVDKLSRIYPAGSRTDSSNYSPVPLWNAGCQIGTQWALQSLTWKADLMGDSGFILSLCLLVIPFSVALNFQTSCTDMDVHQGRFLVNGKSGYVLKPAFMRNEATEFDPITLTQGPWLKHKTLHVMVSVFFPPCGDVHWPHPHALQVVEDGGEEGEHRLAVVCPATCLSDSGPAVQRCAESRSGRISRCLT